jgi:crotonobetainyl-CoA:carnitine CoA-transferase CaiB-like acyl-CoA transferase
MRVLDVSCWRPMPHATQILADLGADVLKVEPPGGDPMRVYPELFASVARGKRSVEIDLKAPEGLARARALVADCDVFCEGWRPGVADRLGLGAATFRVEHPSLIYCSISGYGQVGPWRDVPGHDLAHQALAGALVRLGDTPDMAPSVPRLPVADLEAGSVAAIAICAAWARRLVAGEGERIDIAMADAVAWWVGPRSPVMVAGTADTPGASPGYGVFVTADGRWLAIAPLAETGLWDAICSALGLDDLVGLSFAPRHSRTGEVNARIATAIAVLDLDDALARLRAAGAPVAPVLTPEAAAVHEQAIVRDRLADASGTAVARFPAVLSQHPVQRDAPVPGIGAHDGFAPRAS